MDRERFEALVEDAWDAIPQEFRDHFENVAIFIEDEPSAEQLETAGVGPGHTLLGLYEGVPLSRRGHGYPLAMPDRVTLFQRPIEQAAPSYRDIPGVIYDTLWQELAHHLGMDEKEVRAAERRRRRRLQ
ncbi:MAG TPA: metallopeptidase family protein [Bryobacterales bacterium]|nr:metallopeptidase family protein [Bryobacterales bacterium]